MPSPSEVEISCIPGGGRVLVAEDSPFGRRVVAAMLGRLGLEVDLAADGREALEALDRAPYAAVLMDCQMPVMDGYQATAEIRRRQGARAPVPVVAMGAPTSGTDEERCLAAGMDAFLPKPLAIAGLAEVLGRLLAAPQGPPPPPAAAPAPVDGDGAGERVDEEILADLDRTGGDGADGRRLVEMFLSEAANRVDRLRRALATGDLDEAARVAHSLRGSAGCLGARRASALAADLEALCGGRASTSTRTGVAGRALALLATVESELDAFGAVLVSRLAPR